MNADDLVRHCKQCDHYHTNRETCEEYRREQERAKELRERTAAMIMNEAFEGEWWILVDPKTNTWKQTTEAIARNHPVAEHRMGYAITRAQMEKLYDR